MANKVNASKFMGRGQSGLEKKVDANSKKITLLKNIIQSHKSDLGEKLASLSPAGGGFDGSGLLDVEGPDSITLETCDDVDEDGVCDVVDNCPYTENNNQDDYDGDEQGDACDNDIDGDNALNENDSDNYNPFICSDIDGDACEE